MNWMRANCGKTLQDALEYWIDLDRKKRTEGYREKPLAQNQFCRTLSEKCPGISAAKMRRIRAIKRSKHGPHVYKDGDEKL